MNVLLWAQSLGLVFMAGWVLSLHLRVLDLEDALANPPKPPYDPYFMGPEFYTGWFERMDAEANRASPCEDCEARPLGQRAPAFREGQCCLSPTRVPHLRPAPLEHNAD